ncbi:MAG: DUF4954 family protein [Spirochaetales bacterium]|nr:DUF4954 family protein [Spirochaetales bacterium]
MKKKDENRDEINNHPFLNWLEVAYKKTMLSYRKLRAEEIEKLEKAGNQAEDWKVIEISDDVALEKIKGSSFSGKVLLHGNSDEKQELMPGFFHNCGIYNSRINNGIINMKALVLDCNLVSGYIVEEGCCLFANGPIIYQSRPKAIGCQLSPGNETGGREIILWPDIDFYYAEKSLVKAWSFTELQRVQQNLKSYLSNIKDDFGIIGSHSKLIKNKMIRNSFIGESSFVEAVEMIQDSVIFPSSAMAVKMKQGVIVDQAMIQGGCSVESHCIIEKSLLCEASGVSRHGKVSQSVLGPNTHVAEGEVTASFVGPFVGFHHQSLLISAIWPEGKGNIAYGANVGSNHTGKSPDQEITPGEGCFYGLGCNIKFPANYSSSPYSLFATAVLTLPQKIDFPFSLIQQAVFNDAAIPSAYNEIKPGWVFHQNAYLIYRSVNKFRNRNKAPSYCLEAEILRDEIIEKVFKALVMLESPLEIRAYYTSEQLQGLGKNFMTESSRKQGIESYCFILALFALRQYWKHFSMIQKGSFIFPKESPVPLLFNRFGFDAQAPKELLLSYLSYEKAFLEGIIESRDRDFLRGRKIFDDYDRVHDSLDKDEVIIAAKNDFTAIEKKVTECLGLN